MLEALRDQSVESLIAIAALILTLLGLVVSRRSRKRLSYRAVLQQRLLSVKEDLVGRVQITFDGNPVRDVRMVLIHLRNSGNVPIEESDYIQPLGFKFGKGAEVLSAEVVQTKPENMEVSIETEHDEVTLKPDVFNGGDALALKVLLAGNSEVKPAGRIKGVTQLQEMRAREVTFSIFIIVYPFVMSTLFVAALLLIPGATNLPGWFLPLLLIVLAIVPTVPVIKRLTSRDL